MAGRSSPRPRPAAGRRVDRPRWQVSRGGSRHGDLRAGARHSRLSTRPCRIRAKKSPQGRARHDRRAAAAPRRPVARCAMREAGPEISRRGHACRLVQCAKWWRCRVDARPIAPGACRLRCISKARMRTIGSMRRSPPPRNAAPGLAGAPRQGREWDESPACRPSRPAYPPCGGGPAQCGGGPSGSTRLISQSPSTSGAGAPLRWPSSRIP